MDSVNDLRATFSEQKWHASSASYSRALSTIKTATHLYHLLLCGPHTIQIAANLHLHLLGENIMKKKYPLWARSRRIYLGFGPSITVLMCQCFKFNFLQKLCVKYLPTIAAAAEILIINESDDPVAIIHDRN